MCWGMSGTLQATNGDIQHLCKFGQRQSCSCPASERESGWAEDARRCPSLQVWAALGVI